MGLNVVATVAVYARSVKNLKVYSHNGPTLAALVLTVKEQPLSHTAFVSSGIPNRLSYFLLRHEITGPV